MSLMIRCRPFRISPRIVSRLTFIVVSALLALLIYQSRSNDRGHFLHSYRTRYNSPTLFHERHRDPRLRPQCRGFPDTSDVLLVVRTGATEMMEKLPTVMRTVHECVEDKIVFSDMETILGDIHVHDAIAYLPDYIKQWSTELDLYWELQRYGKRPPDTKSLRELNTGKSGWNIDKYKFIPMTEQAYRNYPNKKWYIFVDADTYVFWPNMMAWLNQLNSTEPLLLGSPVFTSDIFFAHGGSGYVISHEAMHRFVGPLEKPVESTRSQKIFDLVGSIPWMDECCGDFLLSRALHDQGIRITSYWPSINGFSPSEVPFAKDNWCKPVLTLHHVIPETQSNLARYERQRGYNNSNILFEDMYDFVMKPYHAHSRENWYNDSEDMLFLPEGTPMGDNMPPRENMTEAQLVSHETFEKCEAACRDDPRCFQFTFSGFQKCGLGFKFSHGKAKQPVSYEGWKSGWLVGRIKDFVQENTPCSGPQWDVSKLKPVDI